jgi:hypothetical protein
MDAAWGKNPPQAAMVKVRSPPGEAIRGRSSSSTALDPEPTAQTDPDRVKTRTPGPQFMNFSRFLAFAAITGSAERKIRSKCAVFQTISEFSHSLDPERPFLPLGNINEPHHASGRSIG